MDNVIEVKNINKKFWVPDKVIGFWPKVKNIVIRKKKDKHIIKNLSFGIKEGEMVGYIGVNGAGKSTTIKMLCGIYPPTDGTITCLGKDPFKKRMKYVGDIGVVFGNRSLLTYDIAPKYSLDLYAAIYKIPKKVAIKRYKQFAKRLKVDKFLDTPVRKLSLGERMKFEIIASLLHKPKIIYLDEPTIGLDLVAREEMIRFLKEVNKNEKTTIILTTHNMDDIEELCERVIIIDDGNKIYDGKLQKVKNKYADWKRITVVYKKSKKPFNYKFEIIEKEEDLLVFKCPNKRLKEVMDKVLESFEIIDLKVEEPMLKEIIKKIYVDKKVK
jgi:ABC-2 type transport system ATP-binding protein